MTVAGLGLAGCGPRPTRCLAGPHDPLSGGDDAGAPQLLRGVDTVVVLMMENRSFDHALGSLSMSPAARASGAQIVDGLTGHEVNLDPNGDPVPMTRLDGNGTLNPRHDWNSSRAAFDGGRNDGFVRASASPYEDEVMTYLDSAHLPFLYGLAAQSTICDRYFSSVMGPTWPNRFYLHAGTSNGQTANFPMGLDAPDTIWERMAEGCWTAKNYYAGAIPWYSGAFPTKAFSGNDAMVPEPMDGFFRDAASGALPHFALIDPDFELNDAHPPHDLALAEAFMSAVTRALQAGPQWARTLLVVTFDEHGGFFDHVAPPLAPDPLPAFRQLGFRVPAIVAGPMARRGQVVSTPYDHLSILATLRTRYGIGSLGPRMDAASDLTACLDPDLVPVSTSTAALLPAVELPRSLVRGAAFHGSSQPELAALAARGGVPRHHIDARPPLARLQSWLRHAQELEAVRVVG